MICCRCCCCCCCNTISNVLAKQREMGRERRKAIGYACVHTRFLNTTESLKKNVRITCNSVNGNNGSKANQIMALMLDSDANENCYRFIVIMLASDWSCQSLDSTMQCTANGIEFMSSGYNYP